MDDCRCQNCGNAGRFTVVVTNESVNGQSCRNACSRMCASILARNEMEKLDGHAGYRTPSKYEIKPMLSGAV